MTFLHSLGVTLHQLRTEANGQTKTALGLCNGMVKDIYTRDNPYSDTPILAKNTGVRFMTVIDKKAG